LTHPRALNGPNVISRVILSGRQECGSERRQDVKIKHVFQKRFEDVMLLILDKEQGAISQRVQAVSVRVLTSWLRS
jgi:hypothetical protein